MPASTDRNGLGIPYAFTLSTLIITSLHLQKLLRSNTTTALRCNNFTPRHLFDPVVFARVGNVN